MKKFTIFLLSLAVSLSMAAQTSIRVQAPNLVEVGETFNITFSIEGENNVSDFQWNQGTDFSVVWGPQKGYSSSVTIINGKRSKTVTNSYTYILVANAAGTFQLPSATATVNGESINSPVTTIEAVASRDSQQSAAQHPASDPSASARSEGSNANENSGLTQNGSDPDIFLRLTLSKNKVVLGEPITATLKLYQRAAISGFDGIKFPTFTGFWSQETYAPSSVDFKRENVNGTIYEAAVLRTYTIIPQQVGELPVDAAEMVCLVNVRVAPSSGSSFFDSFFQDDYRTVRKKVVAPGTTVKVLPLPAGAPASFGGGVGSFKMNAEVSSDSLKTHDAASLKITVTGQGNAALLEAPDIVFPPDFEVYDVRTSDVAQGKVFEYPFIPRSHGEFTIGPVEYAYYDISSGKYVTLTSQEFKLSVAKGTQTSTGSSEGQIMVSDRTDVRNLASDIRFIVKDAQNFRNTGKFFLGSVGFWIVVILMILLAAVSYFVAGAVLKSKGDVASSKRRTASKIARKKLSAAGGYLEKNLYTAFYEELHKALLGYVSDKLSMDLSEMSKDNICCKLTESGVDEGTAAEFISLLDACEFARYAPDAGHEAMNSHYQSALNVISAIDENMKNKSSHVAAIVAVLLVAGMSLPQMASARSEYPDSLWNAGVQAYMDGNWQGAREAWNSVLDAGVSTTDLYYNLGNACFKVQDYAGAVLAYERALKLDPSNSDARFNLGFVNSLIKDKIDVVPEFFLKSWSKKLSYCMGSDGWTLLFVIFLAIALIAAVLFFRSPRSVVRKSGFFASLAALVLSIVCIIFAISQKQNYFSKDAAVVVSPVSTVKSSPSETGSVDLFVLHEGTKVKILDRVGNWESIELSDGRQGWISTKDIEII